MTRKITPHAQPTLISEELHFAPRYVRSLEIERDLGDVRAVEGYVFTPTVLSQPNPSRSDCAPNRPSVPGELPARTGRASPPSASSLLTSRVSPSQGTRFSIA